MSHVLEIDEPLTADETEQVRAFAEFLVSRRPLAGPHRVPASVTAPISFDGWAGCLAHVRPELSDKEFMRMIEDERVAEAMK